MRVAIYLMLLCLISNVHARSPFIDQLHAYTKITGRSTAGYRVEMVLAIPDMDKDVIGACEWPTRNIYIVKRYWVTATPALREELIFHELGHCDLQQAEHRNKLFPDRCHASIMHDHLGSEHCYLKHKQQLIHELRNFKPIQ